MSLDVAVQARSTFLLTCISRTYHAGSVFVLVSAIGAREQKRHDGGKDDNLVFMMFRPLDELIVVFVLKARSPWGRICRMSGDSRFGQPSHNAGRTKNCVFCQSDN
jgi:hypothetical protein